MPLPFLPLVIAAMVGTAYHQTNKREARKGQITPERELIFNTALNELKDPEKLKKLADVYRSEGLGAYAELLEKRAKLRELPAATKQARRDAYKKAMSSNDSAKVKMLADAFEKEGATGAASSLREYAVSLESAPKPEVKPTQVVPEGLKPELKQESPVESKV